MQNKLNKFKTIKKFEVKKLVLKLIKFNNLKTDIFTK